MKYIIGLFLSLFFVGVSVANAQQMVFSEPEKDDARSLNFEILGKIDNKILIYKNTRDLHQMAVYDSDMKLLDKVKMDYLTEKGKVLSTDFIQYSDNVLLLYQFQNKNIVYAMAVKIDGNGKKIGDPVILDTTSNLNFTVDNKIYTFINSEDKQKIVAFKISTKNEKEHVVTSCIYDKSLNLLEKVKTPIGMPEKNDFLGEFGLANNGNIVCLRQSGTGQNENINKVSLLIKPIGAINFKLNNLPINKIFLDDTRLKIDNRNGHCIITSFFSKIRRGNVDGLYYTLWDLEGNKELLNATTTFTEEYRSDVRGDGSQKMAFNDFYLKNLILRKDGGFMMIAESSYVTNRGNTLNRWDNMNGNPFYNPFGGGFSGNSFNNYPMYGGFNNYNMMNNNMGNNVNRYYAENVAIISFEPDGKMEWSNVIRKTQYDDNTDNYIGYGIVNSGDQVHFLFNLQEKRSNVLTDQSMSPIGQIDRNPTIKNLDKGYDFMPKHIKQVGLRQAVMPCMYRGYTCFVKVDF